MNYLAHLYLSGDDPEVIVGNFMGDSIKGKDYSLYSKGMETGIRLHRFIDHYTDNHPIVERSKKRLRPHFSKYAPVVSDMYFDHFLARSWEDFHDEELLDFSGRMYAILLDRKSDMPQQTQLMLLYMSRNDWLTSYASTTGLNRAFNGMANRTTFESNMEVATEELERNFTAYEDEFRAFFPELVSAAKEELLRLQGV